VAHCSTDFCSLTFSNIDVVFNDESPTTHVVEMAGHLEDKVNLIHTSILYVYARVFCDERTSILRSIKFHICCGSSSCRSTRVAELHGVGVGFFYPTPEVHLNHF